MKHKYNFFISHYFPIHFIALGVGMLVGFPLLIMRENNLIATVFFIFGLLLVSTHWRIIVDLEKKTIKEFVWLFGTQVGKTQNLPKIQCIEIKPVNQEISYGDIDYGRKHTNQRLAEAYLVFEFRESVFLGKSSNSEKLADKLKALAKNASLEILNNC